VKAIIEKYPVIAVILMLKKWNWLAPGRLRSFRRGEKPRKSSRKT